MSERTDARESEIQTVLTAGEMAALDAQAEKAQTSRSDLAFQLLMFGLHGCNGADMPSAYADPTVLLHRPTIGKHDARLKILITRRARNDLHVVATLHRASSSSEFRRFILQGLFGEIGVLRLAQGNFEVYGQNLP